MAPHSSAFSHIFINYTTCDMLDYLLKAETLYVNIKLIKSVKKKKENNLNLFYEETNLDY